MVENTCRDEVLAYLRLLVFARACGNRLLSDPVCDRALSRCIQRIAAQWDVSYAALATLGDERNVYLH